METNRKVPPKGNEPQAPAAPQRMTARRITELLDRICKEIEALPGQIKAKAHKEAAIPALFDIMGYIEDALRQITGTSVIVYQYELEEFDRIRDIQLDTKSNYNAWPVFRYLKDTLDHQHRKGCLFQPGDMVAVPNEDGDTLMIFSKKHHEMLRAAYRKEKQVTKLNGVKVETPKPEDLEAMFNKPSEQSPASEPPTEQQ